ncbi:MAG: undecaprenyl/decaprenyl-phosphate alpha-N-acetylglucosaminyl 1-phosphate transferase [Chitinophagales bacterium]|nr:undecaprenyl/decaprenyl-phosphate alpha-N-acetylglucosaminyl 1-phosphate transferase [Chitinophagales bacterium]
MKNFKMEVIMMYQYLIERMIMMGIEIPLAAITSCAIAWLVINILIRNARKWNLMDQPNFRKEHKSPVPTLGGVGIFMGTVISTAIWIGPANLEIKCIIAALFILFLTGVWDDLKDISASRKLFIQLLTATGIAICGIRIESLGGLFGIGELPVVIQYALSVLIIAGITNAMNLLDGIDGLAGGIACLNSMLFSVLFAIDGEFVYSGLALILAGSLLGFLRYNFNPAKIFMGDTGSLIIGFLMAVFAIKYLQVNTTSSARSLVIVYSICILPVFDTLRVFLIRLLKGKSPFSADKSHIHHLLVKVGYDHRKSAILLYSTNVILICTGFIFAYSGIKLLTAFILLTGLAILFSELISVVRAKRINRRLSDLNISMQTRFKKNYLLKKISA